MGEVVVVLRGVGRSRFGSAWAVVGLFLAALLATWVSWAASGVAGARPGPVLALIGATVAAVVLGWVGGRSAPTLAVLAVATAALLLLAGGGATLEAAAGGPLGYANANAHLAGLGFIAALGAVTVSCAWPRSRDSPVGSEDHWVPGWVPVARRSITATVGCGLTIPLTAALVIPTSKAAVSYLAVVTAMAALAFLPRRPQLMVLGGAAVVAVSLAGTLAVGAGVVPEQLSSLTAARGDLWSGAVDVTTDHPVRGIGPGRFTEENPVTYDRDLRWAHHGFLHSAAELGVFGGALVVAVVIWGYVGLWWAAARAWPSSVGSLVGVAALTYLGLHATVDYVLHFPVLVVTVAGLVGWSMGAAVRIPAVAPAPEGPTEEPLKEQPLKEQPFDTLQSGCTI